MGAETLTTQEETQERKQSRAESGHAINIANFAELVVTVKNFSPDYNPAFEDLKTANLEKLGSRAVEIINAVHAADAIYHEAVDTRQLEFTKMQDILTRVNAILQAAGVSNKIEEEFSAITRKLRGARKNADTPSGRSTSQMSYDNRLNNFTQFVIKLKGIGEYTPSEATLTVEALESFITSLSEVTTASDAAWNNLDIARHERDNFLYANNTGLVPVAQRVKSYTKGIYGSKSAEYKRLTNLKFKKN